MNNFIFDIDGTLRNFEPKPDIHPELLRCLQKLKLEGEIFVVTGRTYKNFNNFISELSEATSEEVQEADLFKTIYCEDGHIYYDQGEPNINIDEASLDQLKKVRTFLNKQIKLKSTDYSINLPHAELISEVTITIQEDSNKMSFIDEVKNYINTNNLNLLQVIRLTHNRFVVNVKGVGKKYAIKSHEISMEESYYFCDEKNDMELAVEIKSRGGKVICPSNAINELKEIADYISEEACSHGVVGYLSKYFKKSSY